MALVLTLAAALPAAARAQEPVDSGGIIEAWTRRQAVALTSPPRARVVDAIRVDGRLLSLWGYDSRGDLWRRDYRLPPRGDWSAAVVGSDVLVRTSPVWWIRPLLEYSVVAGAATLGALATDDWRVAGAAGLAVGIGLLVTF